MFDPNQTPPAPRWDRQDFINYYVLRISAGKMLELALIRIILHFAVVPFFNPNVGHFAILWIECIMLVVGAAGVFYGLYSLRSRRKKNVTREDVIGMQQMLVVCLAGLSWAIHSVFL